MSDQPTSKPAAETGPGPKAPASSKSGTIPETEAPLLATVSPHIRARDDVPRIMWTVVVALLPAVFAACYFFGLPAIKIIVFGVVAAVATEAVVQKLSGRKVTAADGSAVVTGLLVAFITPSNAPWFIPVTESVFAIAIVKLAFGGLGCNIWNPALAGRAFAVACFGALMIGGWQPVPPDPDARPALRGRQANWVEIADIPLAQTEPPAYGRADAVTGASPLSAQKDYRKSLVEGSSGLGKTPRGTLRLIQERNSTPLRDLFIGARVGCVGETSALAILVGAAILLARKVIKWHIPVAFIGTVALLGWLLPLNVGAMDGDKFYRGWVWAGGQPLFEVLAGGVMLGAIFMATDMVTSPLTRAGQLIFGCGCGLLTVIIRKYGGYPEGVCYSILLMNTAVPLIDGWTKPRVYGKKRP